MKVMTILGTRPEIIRLSRVIDKLDACCEHVLVHTGQNFDRNLSQLFFEQMRIRQPDCFLEAGGGRVGRQIGEILARSEEVLLRHRPDRVLILGDTNSCLAAVMAKRMGIPVYHMEAGNRCFDDRVPEEVNRRIVDHSSDIHMPYTERSRANLLSEGLPSRNIYVTGNPILEVLNHYSADIGSSPILQQLGLEPAQFFLVTLHRAENVDLVERLVGLLESLKRLAADYRLPVIISTHPRTKDRMETAGLASNHEHGLRFLPPFGFFDFVALEKTARCVLSDSGTVQEECCIFGVPNVTLRDVTERPETVECGSNVLAGADPDAIARSVRQVMASPCRWSPPAEYLVENVSETVVRLLCSYRHWGP
jgi:UDP-N-acetylglucosamine 2-epimerase (non-hydrolysing)